ncbi:MAG: hypothetical protein COA88_13040 [Kordia sp.]|nr:MAG: hypothetical protein COA88_13040 [Kordia sp.]
MKKLLYTLAIVLPILVLGQSTDQNYVKTTTYKKAVQLNPGNPDTSGVLDADKIEQITYYDGLGRPIQANAHKAGGNGNNIITHIEYDGIGRQTKTHLPAPGVTNTQNYVSNGADLITSYYETAYGNDLNSNEPNPYSEVQYEGSPLNRILEQAAPGKDWSMDSGHTIKFDYQSNIENEVRLFEVEFPDPTNTEDHVLVYKGHYNANELYKTITKDENWIAANGKANTTEEFKDKQGRVILKRTYNLNASNVVVVHDTQYVYDKFGNLSYVFSPNGSDSLVTDLSYTYSSTTIPYNLFSAFQVIKLGVISKTTKGTINKQPINTNSGEVKVNLSGNTLTLTVNLNFNPSTQLRLGGIQQLNGLVPDVSFNTQGALNGYEFKIENGFLTVGYPVPPYVKAILPSVSSLNGTFTIDLPSYEIKQEVLDGLCYQYKYDYRNRLVEKKIPGKAWEYIVYDQLDRPRLTQDANLAGTNEWLFTKYDAFGRVTYTGKTFYISSLYVTGTPLRRELQSIMNSQSVLNESRTVHYTLGNDAYFEYTNNAYPIIGDNVLTVNYYDTYPKEAVIVFGGIPGSFGILGSTTQTPSIKTKTLSVAGKVRVLGTDQWVFSAMYYDKKARLLVAKSKNYYLNTTDVFYSEYDFMGNVTASQNVHTKGASPTITVTDGFTYDHQNRLIKQVQYINNIGPKTIVSNQYDEIGQLIKKDVGGTSLSPLQVIDYTYNIRGWLKGINNVANIDTPKDLFAFEINYNTAEFSDTEKLYNGNISETHWLSASDNVKRSYAYSYDALNRILQGRYKVATNTSMNDRYNLNYISYDKNGNIKSLLRNGFINNSSAITDNLTYDYATNSNVLKGVSDASSQPDGFNDGNTSGNDYTYDFNGNMKTDANKQITSISYNHLNLPVTIYFLNPGDEITYVYDAAGVKLEKKVFEHLGGAAKSISGSQYAGNFNYKIQGVTGTMPSYNPTTGMTTSGDFENYTLQFFNHPEGYVEPTENPDRPFQYVYQYKDHLGNIRLSYSDDDNDGHIDVARDTNGDGNYDFDVDGDPQGPSNADYDYANEIREENNYYPFGLKHKGYNNVITGRDHKYGFGGKEYNDELGLDWYDVSARNYDPALGRWMNLDPLAEMMRSHSPYNFAFNNPIYFQDYDGMAPSPPLDYFDMGGNKIGNDGVSDGRKAVVSDRGQARDIKRTDRRGGNTQLGDVSSAEVLPSDAALAESLNVLQRTESSTAKDSSGGLHGESSIVMKDGTVVRGESGDAAYINSNNELQADESLPAIPSGSSESDVEATIHAHVTGTKLENNQVYSHDGTKPSDVDSGTFAKFGTNIIVGPTGQASATNTNGNISISQPGNGVSIFKGNSATPSVTLKTRAVQKILNN